MVTAERLHHVTLSARAPGATYAARFFLKGHVVDGECWRWGAGFFDNGYGQFHVERRGVGAHVVAWVLARGDVPPGLCVLHRCDNRWCVRPDHLFLGTPRDNARDMAAKGRSTFQTHPEKTQGENHRHKLTAEQVRMVRTSTRSALDLALELGVKRPNIYAIRHGRIWRSLAAEV